MFRGVRISVIVAAMMVWGFSVSIATKMLMLVPAYLLDFEELSGLALLGGWPMGLVLGFWVGVVREWHRAARAASEQGATSR